MREKLSDYVEYSLCISHGVLGRWRISQRAQWYVNSLYRAIHFSGSEEEFRARLARSIQHYLLNMNDIW
jgi:hypothetical protein